MSRRMWQRVAGAVVAGLVIAGPMSAAASADTPQVNRYSGPDRYATSASVAVGMLEAFSRAVFPGDDIVFASGASFADALAASALAGDYRAPILLVPPTGPVPQVTLDAITTVLRAGGPSADPGDVPDHDLIVVGGNAAVSQAVYDQLEAHVAGLDLEGPVDMRRIAGADRYETARLIAADIDFEDVGTFNVNVASGLPPDNRRFAFLVSGTSFADALVAGPPAYDSGKGLQQPVLLTERDTIPQPTLAALAQQQIGLVFVVGGQGVVSDAALAQLPDGIEVIRIDGADRFETAANMAGVLLLNVDLGGFGWIGVTPGLANLLPAGGGADALSAAPYLGLAQSPLLGMGGAEPPEATVEVAQTFNLGTRITALNVFGGQAAVPDSAVQAFLDAISAE